MYKISAESELRVLAAMPAMIEKQAAKIARLQAQVDGYEREVRVQKLASDMYKKGMYSATEAPPEVLVPRLNTLLESDPAKFANYESLTEQFGPDMGARLFVDERSGGNDSAKSDLDSYIING